MVKQLLDQGFDINSQDTGFGTPLHQTVRGGHLHVMKYLLDRGANITAKADPDRRDMPQFVLHEAASSGFLKAVQYLIEVRGMSTRMRGSRLGTTPLHISCHEGHLPVVKYLVENHGGVHSFDYLGRTPLHLAVHGGNMDVIEYLLDQGAGVAAVTKNCQRVMRALWEDNPWQEGGGKVRLFLSYFLGYTPLNFAMSRAVARKVLEHDFSRALSGGTYNPNTTNNLLCARNGMGETHLATAKRHSLGDFQWLWPREQETHQHLVGLVDYLELWVCSRLYIPGESTSDKGEMSFELSMVQNPTLSPFQRFLAESLYNCLEQTAVGEVCHLILGYLTPQDVLTGWHQWLNPEGRAMLT